MAHAVGAWPLPVRRRRSILEQLARDVCDGAHVVQADLARLDSVTQWLGAAEVALGPIDLLVNNAGSLVCGRRRVTALPMGSTEELAARVCRAVEQGSGRVIYPRAYTIFRYAPWLARWLLDRLTPAPLPRRAERSVHA